ncbi:MAG: ABC transporter ATP-binding protein [Saprospiraceae bacterium]|nr:ABC transporter ATP-binding protein [Saprospiraceae bacterium]
MNPSEPIIQIQNLKKSYGNTLVLKGINLDIYPGQIIGYIGPNGAGKSTTIRILTGLDASFEGQVTIAGLDIRKQSLEVKKIIGYVPENAELYDVLTPMEFLSLVGKLHHLPDATIRERATRMLQFFGLGDNLADRMDTFSKGMRQKVLLISGLLHNPQIIFLDEPLSGLDANSVIMVKEIISRLAAEGKTIFYCSHMMDVVEKVAHRIILITDGQILADGSFKELQQQEGDTLERIFSQLTGKSNIENLANEFLSSFDQ